MDWNSWHLPHLSSHWHSGGVSARPLCSSPSVWSPWLSLSVRKQSHSLILLINTSTCSRVIKKYFAVTSSKNISKNISNQFSKVQLTKSMPIINKSESKTDKCKRVLKMFLKLYFSHGQWSDWYSVVIRDITNILLSLWADLPSNSQLRLLYKVTSWKRSLTLSHQGGGQSHSPCKYLII